jgi:hypothetical protein
MEGFMKTYNPLYPPTSYKEIKELPERMQERFRDRHQDLQALMAALSRKAK